MKAQKISENAVIPKRTTEFAAGYDLYSAYNYVITARTKGLILTDIILEIPEKHYGRVAPRSGLAIKNGIDVGAGVIDSDYRGNIGVVLFNHSNTDFNIVKGDRIAQIIITPIITPEIIESDVSETDRGEKGFGSTGF